MGTVTPARLDMGIARPAYIDAGTVTPAHIDLGNVCVPDSPYVPPDDWYQHYVVGLGLEAVCLAHYPMDELSGSVAYDDSGNDNHGTYVGGPQLGEPPIGSYSDYSVALDGSNTQYVLAPAPVTVDYSSESFTVCVRFATTITLDTIFLLCPNPLVNEYVAAFTSGTNVIVRAFDSPINRSITLAGAADGLPHALVIRWDVSTSEITAFIDGVQSATLTATGWAPSPPDVLGFGGAPTTLVGVGRLDGGLDEGAIFDGALSDADCLALSTLS